MNTIIGSLTTLSRTQRRPPFGSVFLLNNISHLVSHLVLRPTNPNTPSLLSKPTSDFLTSSWRTAKTSGSGWKAAAKEKFTRFYDLLEEVGERHRIAKVLEDDSEERSAVGEEVVRLVVPSLQRFMQKQKEKEFSKSELFALFVCNKLTLHQILKSVSRPVFLRESASSDNVSHRYQTVS
ncbi:hypothetical protein BDR04DRAFT_46931 [Suillus decipiens]|nr:hypothetical protein BDR04DRAFT_46931 [Suillus decipiens]